MTIRRYGELDRTGDLSLLKRRWNPFPVKWFDTESFFDDFKDIFEDTSKSKQDEAYKIIAFNNIIIIDSILKTLIILMQNYNDRLLAAMTFGKDYPDEKQIDFYKEKIKKLTGIKIESIEDLKKVQKEIERKLDKYKERFKDGKTEKQSFIDIAMSVFSFMGMGYNDNINLVEFSRLKQLADKKIKQLENARDKRNSK